MSCTARTHLIIIVTQASLVEHSNAPSLVTGDSVDAAWIFSQINISQMPNQRPVPSRKIAPRMRQSEVRTRPSASLALRYQMLGGSSSRVNLEPAIDTSTQPDAVQVIHQYLALGVTAFLAQAFRASHARANRLISATVVPIADSAQLISSPFDRQEPQPIRRPSGHIGTWLRK